VRKEKEMRRQSRCAIVLIALLAIPPLLGFAQTPSGADVEIEDRLVRFAAKMRLCLSITSLAIYAPSIGDLHLHAQQVVNLLEGSEGRHYVRPAGSEEEVVGLRREVTHLATWLEETQVGEDVRPRLAAATKNVNAYLEMALDATLAALSQRRIPAASTELLRTYAFLCAAYEIPSDLPYVPGLSTILRWVGVVEWKAESEPGT